jgi:two-component system NarL family sensor kinase
MFRVLQESLTNVHRHSDSPTAHVSLIAEDGAVSLEIRDQGKGIPLQGEESKDRVAALGVGLRGMRERMTQVTGSLEIVSSQEGTTVKAMVSMSTPEADSIKQSTIRNDEVLRDATKNTDR